MKFTNNVYKKFLSLLLLTFSISIFLNQTQCLALDTDKEMVENLNEQELKALAQSGKYFWVIYDNVCPYCRSATKNIRELDWERKFKFLSYRDPETYKIFPNLTKEECEKDVHMITPKGEVLVGYQVFRAIIDNLTATKLFNPFLKNDYAEKKLEGIYDKMVKKRSCYYKKSNCPLKKNK